MTQAVDVRPEQTVADLRQLAEQFLSHLVQYRRYSPATARAYRRDITRFLDYLQDTCSCKELYEVSTREVRLFLASLGGLAPSTVRRTLYGISSFFQYLVEADIIDENPAAPVDPPKVKRKLPKVPSWTQCKRTLDACEAPIEAAVIGLLMLAGLRRSELLGLDVADVGADLGSIRVEGKGGRQRVVPVSSRLRKLLETHLSGREASDSSALLLNAAGHRMQATTMYRIFKRVLERAGLGDSGITPHSLRHAFATGLVRAGVDVATISELLGHASIATTSIYLHASSETRRDAVERLSSLGGGTDAVEYPQRG